MTDSARWQAVQDRDSAADGRFVYAVTSTGIYCRPSCASRRPRRHNVRFFELPEAAEQAGFRSCKRCRPRDEASLDPTIEKVRRICHFLDASLDDADGGAPTLAEIAAAVGGSPHHLQRTFKRHLGVTPRQYADARRLRRLKEGLKDGENVTGAMYDAGYGAASRLYERSNGQLGMTPATYAKGGKGARIGYAITDSPLGRLMVAATASGVCFLSLGEDRHLIAELRHDYPLAEIVADDIVLGDWVRTVIDYLEGAIPHPNLPLDVRGTAFQRRVWEELMRIPAGVTTTYSELAERVSGNPEARRAVARGCATNPVSLVIPCHRVLREDGGLGGYRWGLQRKQALIDGERRHRDKDAA
ncbi:MAG: bifunctional DNA-binding transcriptional regulator/O6-methylguanine-DNA methyltransferase Ada [Alphaproteobacteria bacterium]|nr:bifunctional DNA-binding transcriptional regulator/O6-methylguanine-DNA methyltransferase Ada [Alphaproteobacteria bacterium]MDP6563832.1 bifunctional DNA-binding transcriptional regulator/O6-methylguanine-DNA methyltransferase Ada [Alphaproteobacteria bacterium]MDP6811731.1 bifunctional DNA-binding transcriptional regulator/O6-methylguanine-DNA methyltransferase Ada [Alphaproteobacteria bacterium]